MTQKNSLYISSLGFWFNLKVWPLVKSLLYNCYNSFWNTQNIVWLYITWNSPFTYNLTQFTDHRFMYIMHCIGLLIIKGTASEFRAKKIAHTQCAKKNCTYALCKKKMHTHYGQKIAQSLCANKVFLFWIWCDNLITSESSVVW